MNVETSGTTSPEAMVQMIAKRYGEDSNAALMARLSWLLELIGDETRTEADWEPLRARIEKHYTLDDPVPSSVASYIKVQKLADGYPGYTFSSEEYVRRYGDARPTQTLSLTEKEDVVAIADGRWRLFVVSESNELLVHTHAMDVTELIMNRNDDGSELPLVHPTLVRDRRLTVKAAGEVAFIRTDFGSVGAVFNTKSGHFCPSPDTCATVVAQLGKLIGKARIAAIPVRLRASVGY